MRKRPEAGTGSAGDAEFPDPLAPLRELPELPFERLPEMPAPPASLTQERACAR